MKQQTIQINLFNHPTLTQRPKGKRGGAMFLALFLGFALQNNSASAVATCGTVPDTLVNGSGTFTTALCEANATAETAASVAAIANTSATTANAASETWYQTLKNYAVQVEQLAKEIITAQNTVIQTERMIKDLEENPLQVIVPDTKQLQENQKRIDSLAKDIVNNSNNVGDNLMRDLTNPSTIGLGEGSRFQLWSEARSKAIQESYDKVLAFSKNQAKESERITKAIENINAAQGKTATDKAMANAAGQQLALIQDIKELLRQLLGMQSTENGARLDAQVASEAALRQQLATPPGSSIDMPEDSYSGPSNVRTKGF